jgi:hypothetical protein
MRFLIGVIKLYYKRAFGCKNGVVGLFVDWGVKTAQKEKLGVHVRD